MRTWTSLLAAALHATSLTAITFDEQHTIDRAVNPNDVVIRLATAGGRTRFQRGEEIPLRLSFSTQAKAKYRLNSFTYDRAGRLPLDEFVMEGSGAVDPYVDFFGPAVLGYIGGGAGGAFALEATPHEFHMTLNDVFRFDRAGSYRFYIKSHRLSYLSPAGNELIGVAPASNILAIEILPADPSWEQAKLVEIGKVLAASRSRSEAAAEKREAIWERDDEADQARRQLKWMGTPEAVRLELDHARATGKRPNTLTLIGARNRRQTIAELHACLPDRSESNLPPVRDRSAGIV